MDSSSSPAPAAGASMADGRRDEDLEMTDAPLQPDAGLSESTFTTSQFLPPASDSASPAPTPPPSNGNLIPQNTTILESTEKPTMPTKKKGQASIKKVTKRSKGAATGGPKAAKKQSKKAAAAAARTDEGTNGVSDGGDSDEDEQSDHGPYCICRGPDDHRFMIGCDICEDWFHGECVDIDKDVGEHLIERFVCPNCTNENEGQRTVFKKTCSWRNCKKPARLYDGREKKDRSDFCSDEHKQLWWEKLIATLPKKTNSKAAVREGLTQEEFMALLDSDLAKVDVHEGTFKLSTQPFAALDETTEGADAKKPLAPGTLTSEQEELIRISAAERYKMGEEIVMCQKMLQLMEMASDRRKALIAAKQLDDSACGYDFRLDTVGVQAPFVRWLSTDEGQAIFRTGDLDHSSVLSGDGKNICDKKRCKPHQGWYGIHTRDVKFQMRQLAAEAEKQLSRERDIREAALERKLRMANADQNVIEYDGKGNIIRGVL